MATQLPHRSAVARALSAGASRLLRPVFAVTQRSRSSQLDALGACQGAVVFLGDSISEQGEWGEWFPGVPTSNRGIGGETSAQIYARLDSAIDNPSAVFLLCGTNDLAAGVSPHRVALRIGAILDEVTTRSPGCRIYLQSVMPRKASFASEIARLNALLRSLARQRATTEFIDLWPVLAGPDHALRRDFSHDGLHLNGSGYAAWVAAITPLVLSASPHSEASPETL